MKKKSVSMKSSKKASTKFDSPKIKLNNFNKFKIKSKLSTSKKIKPNKLKKESTAKDNCVLKKKVSKHKEEDEMEESDDYDGEEDFEDSVIDDFANDSSDDGEEDGANNLLNMNLIKKWESSDKSEKSSIYTFKKIQRALTTVLAGLGSDSAKEKRKAKISTVSPQVFNGIIRLCLTRVPEILRKVFEVNALTDRPKRTKRWAKFHVTVKNYLDNLISLMKSISEPSNLSLILKRGLLPILSFYAEFPALQKDLVRLLVTLWSTSSEGVRVSALVALFRVLRSCKKEHKEKTLKMMYISYVNNCRFTSPTTLAVIHFMRTSLAELFRTDQGVAYRLAFIYVKQLGSHLANAVEDKKKERLQMVYNWQYVHALHLWAEVLCVAHPSEVLNPLIYPVTEVATGVITLVSSPCYYPTVFRLCSILIDLGHRTNTFIPVIPHLLKILSCPRLLKKPQSKSNEKSLKWDSILKVSASQKSDPVFCDGLIHRFCDLTLEYLNVHCSSIAFPELIFPLNVQMKKYIKACKNPAYTRQIKQLSAKINENVDFVNERRRNVAFALADKRAVKSWQIECEQSGPPIRKFWESERRKKTSGSSQDASSTSDNDDDSEQETDPFSVKEVRGRNESAIDDPEEMSDLFEED